MSGPVTCSRSRADSSSRGLVDHTGVGMAEQAELMNKLTELLDVIEKSTRTNLQSQEQLAENTEKVFAAKLTSDITGTTTSTIKDTDSTKHIAGGPCSPAHTLLWQANR